MKHSDFVDFYNILDPHYPDGRILQRIKELSYLVPKDLGTIALLVCLIGWSFY